MNTTIRIEQSIKGLIVLIASLLLSTLSCLLILPLERLANSEVFGVYLIGVTLISALSICITFGLISLTLSAYGIADCLFWTGQTIFQKWNNLMYRMIDAYLRKIRTRKQS